MATLATYFRATTMKQERRESVRAQADPYRLRALPNDGIYFCSKRIDNSRVVRQADPAAGGECWSAVAAVGLLLMLGGSVIAPHVASILAGYKLESLKTERQTLIDQSRALDVQEAGLLSPERLNNLARAHSLTSPASDQVIHLDTASSVDASFARVQPPAPAHVSVR